MGKDRLSWLCRDEQARERLLDMDRRLRGARAAALAVLAIALVAVGHWEGWWTLAVLAIAFAGFAITGPFVHRVSHPEYVMAGAWVLSSVAIAVSVALTGGPTSPAASWLAIPAVTLAARFDGRGVAAGLALLVVLMLAATLGVDPGAVADRPALLVLPLAVLMAATLLTTPLMSSDREHRSESVLDGLTGMLNRRSLAARAAELDEQAALDGPVDRRDRRPTSTTSRPSTTSTATSAATRSSSTSPTRCARSCAPSTSPTASAARSSSCCSRARRSPTPRCWPSACGRPSSPRPPAACT